MVIGDKTGKYPVVMSTNLSTILYNRVNRTQFLRCLRVGHLRDSAFHQYCLAHFSAVRTNLAVCVYLQLCKHAYEQHISVMFYTYMITNILWTIRHWCINFFVTHVCMGSNRMQCTDQVIHQLFLCRYSWDSSSITDSNTADDWRGHARLVQKSPATSCILYNTTDFDLVKYVTKLCTTKRCSKTKLFIQCHCS